MNNLIVSDMELVDPQIDEFFQTGEAFREHEYYADLMPTCAAKVKTAYPEVVDSLAATALLSNGAADDFVDIPTIE